jgi:hypothetical protein
MACLFQDRTSPFQGSADWWVKLENLVLRQLTDDELVCRLDCAPGDMRDSRVKSPGLGSYYCFHEEGQILYRGSHWSSHRIDASWKAKSGKWAE